MNDSSATSQPGASLIPDGIETLTVVHFIILALIAIGVVAMIVAGIRRKRIRARAAQEIRRNAEEAGVAPPAAEVEAEPARPAPASEGGTHEPAAPPPVAPPRVSEPAPLDDRPIAAAAPMAPRPAGEAAAEPAPGSAPPAASAPLADSPADGPVTQLKGLGPKVSTKLAELGVTTVGQLAALDDDRAAALDDQLGPFRGRMARDRWIEQARFLAAGDRAGFEAVFGKL